jgi:predicted outer membrane repeat protein
MQQQYLAMAITAAAAFGIATTDSWAVDIYVNDEYIEEDLEADPPIPLEQDTLDGRCSNFDYETIAEALEAASTGDTIILCNCDEEEGGDPELTTYFPDVDGNAAILIPQEIESITIMSAFGPDRCIVSGTNAAGAQYPVVRLDFLEQTLTLGDPNDPGKGFLITGGAAPGEDIYPPFDPSGDSNVSRGGGIRVMGKDATVEVYGCTIAGNQSFEDGGAAYCHYNSLLTMNGCTIAGNMANNRGGGIYCDPGGTVTLINSTMESNVASLAGGGIFAPEGSNVLLFGTQVCSNFIPADPMTMTPHLPLHSKNIWGTFDDLGLNCLAVDCATTGTECDLAPNTLESSAFPSIQAAINAAGPNDTINVAAGHYHEFLDMEGKAISLIARDPTPGATIIDPTYLEGDVGGAPSPANFWGQSPCIKFTSGETNATIISGFTLQNGTGTAIFSDALNPFVSGVGGGVLCYQSMPTINACLIRNNIASDGGGVYSGGQSEPSLTGTTYLCNNFPNNLSGYVLWDDACESPTCADDNGDSIPDSCQGVPTTHEVDIDAGPTAITDAIALANSGDTIALAAGTYLETINPLGKAIQFVGAGPNLTILDGMGANRVIACLAGETDGTTFSDLTVTGGYATRGGGALLSGSSPRFTNVEFTDNRSTDSGGGIYMSYGARPVFTDCKFDGNIADWSGGAVHALALCRPVFTNTIFNDNRTGLTGGAVSLITAPSGTPPSYPAVYPHGLIGNRPEFTDCTFTNNRALRYGGGVYAGFASPADFDNCIFENNAGEWGGGGIYAQSVYDYADLNDGAPSQAVLEAYYPHIHNGTVFRCNEPQAINGDGQAWYDPWWGEMAEEENCLTCAPDVNKDLYVDYEDLIRVIAAWGNCQDSIEGNPDSPPAPVLCDEDTDGNYIVDIQDLIAVLQNWRRTCPIE